MTLKELGEKLGNMYHHAPKKESNSTGTLVGVYYTLQSK